MVTTEPGVIRLFKFRPVRIAFDRILREEMIPALVELPGLQDIYVGRQGPDELGPRLVATIWESRKAMASAVGESFDTPVFLPEYLDETTDRELEFLTLAFGYRTLPSEAPGRPACRERRSPDGRARSLHRGSQGRDALGLGGRPRPAGAVPGAAISGWVRHAVGLAGLDDPPGRDGRPDRSSNRHSPCPAAERLGCRALRGGARTLVGAPSDPGRRRLTRADHRSREAEDRPEGRSDPRQLGPVLNG